VLPSGWKVPDRRGDERPSTRALWFYVWFCDRLWSNPRSFRSAPTSSVHQRAPRIASVTVWCNACYAAT